MRVPRPLPAVAPLLFLPLLLSSGVQENLTKTQVWVYPPSPVILAGSSVVMNCSTNCKDTAEIGLETSLSWTPEGNGTNWKAFKLTNVTRDDSPLCFVNCPSGRQGKTRANITVYEPPRNLELNMEPSLEQFPGTCIAVGQNFSLSCKVSGGRPRKNLEVMLLRGDQEIRRLVPANTFDTDTVTFQVMASREDNEAFYYCHANLDLRHMELQLYEKSSLELKLCTFALASKPPVLMSPKLLEVGTNSQVSCEMDKLFPVEKAQIQLSWGGQPLPQDTMTRGELLRARATIMVVEDMEVNERELTCSVSLGNESRRMSKTVTIYTFQPPSFIEPLEPIQEGSQVNITCKGQPGSTVKIIGAPPSEPDRISLIVQEADNGRALTCKATLKFQEETVNKSTSLKLNVLFPPKLDEKCPGNFNWDEGTEQILQCEARGNPVPKVECDPKNHQDRMPLGKLHRVSRAHNGTYHCTAKNFLGETVKVVTVVVNYHDVDLTPIISSIVVAVIAVAFLLFMGYLYYRQQRIRSYELKKTQEAAALRPINSGNCSSA